MDRDKYMEQLEEENLKLVTELQEAKETNITIIKKNGNLIELQNQLYEELKEAKKEAETYKEHYAEAIQHGQTLSKLAQEKGWDGIGQSPFSGEIKFDEAEEDTEPDDDEDDEEDYIVNSLWKDAPDVSDIFGTEQPENEENGSVVKKHFIEDTLEDVTNAYSAKIIMDGKEMELQINPNTTRWEYNEYVTGDEK